MKKPILLTILLLAAAISLQARPTDRGLGNPKSVYIEKGTWQAGISGSYHSYKAGGLDASSTSSLFGIVNDLDGQIVKGGVSVRGAWFFADNFSIGARFGYGMSNLDLNSATILTLLPLNNKHVDKLNLTGAIAGRGYMPLFDSKILAIFGEICLNGKRGFTKDYEETDRGKYGTYSDDYSASLGFNSGISIFVNNSCAIEISLPVIEAGYSWSAELTQGEKRSAKSHAFASYNPDFIGIAIGATFNF